MPGRLSVLQEQDHQMVGTNPKQEVQLLRVAPQWPPAEHHHLERDKSENVGYGYQDWPQREQTPVIWQVLAKR
jgi:hypothetical protein